MRLDERRLPAPPLLRRLAPLGALAGLLLSPPAWAASPEKGLGQIEEHLEAQEWSQAEEAATELLEKMTPVFGSGDGTEAFARALRLRAVARGATGSPEGRRDAVFDLYIARSIDAAPPGSWTAPFGEPASWIDGLQLREPGSAGAARLLQADHPSPGLALPIPLTDSMPRQPREMIGKWSLEPSRVELLIDEEGRGSQPVFQGQAPPGQILITLEALRASTFLPAQSAAGEAVAVVVVLEQLFSAQFPLFRLAGDEVLGDLYRLGAEGRYEELRQALEPHLRDALTCDPENFRQCSPYRMERLAFLPAMAYAGLGQSEAARWAWQSAWSFNRNWRKVDLRALGGPVAELQQHPVRCWEAAEEGCDVPAAKTGEGWRPPRVVERRLIEAPPGPGAPADRLVVQVIVGREGRPVSPRLVEGVEATNGYRALEAVRHWRFEPARREGEIVESRLEVTVPFAAEAEAPRLQAWEAALEAAEEHLRAAKWPEAQEASRAVLDELLDSLSRGGSDLLARALRNVALAEAGSGRHQEARWHWYVAQNLAAEMKSADLSGLGPAGELLDPHRLPIFGIEAETLSRAEMEAAPAKIQGPSPSFLGPEPDGNLVSEVYLQLDAGGKPIYPRVVVGGAPARLVSALEALRQWRYEPSSSAEAERTVAARLPLTKKARGPREQRQKAEVIGDLAREAAKNGEPKLAGCYWQAAQSLEPSIAFGLSAEDPVERQLERFLLSPKAVWRTPELCPTCAPSHLVSTQNMTPPRKTFAPSPRYTQEARRQRIQGVVIFQTVIGEDGYVREVKILKDLPGMLDVQTLQAVCRWRFEPARLDGEPLAVYYNLTTNFSLSRPDS